MYSNFVYPSVTEALPSLLVQIELDGMEIGSRAGLTKEITHVGITLTEPLDREILCGFRKPNLAAQIAETMWVLSGRDDIAWLENYLPRVTEFSDDGKTWRAGYGKRLRNWDNHGDAKVIDQWRWLIEHLNADRGSRRAVMSIWDPAIDTEPGKDIPCNDWLSFLSRNGYLDLHVALRSNDIIWGWSGINQFEWSALLEITAGMLGMKVGSLHFSTTSFHLYGHHFEKAEKIRTQNLTDLSALPQAPRFDARAVGRDFDRLEALFEAWFLLEELIRGGKNVSSLVQTFPEPMLRSWLQVLQWWWTGDRGYLPAAGNRLAEATRPQYSMQPKISEIREAGFDTVDLVADVGIVRTEVIGHSDFIRFATETHLSKHAAYGDSWKRRGEMLGIMANIARKVDRLGGAETADETSADTAMDLMVYLAKYHTWLGDLEFESSDSDNPHEANRLLFETDFKYRGISFARGVLPDSKSLEKSLRDNFESLEEMVVEKADRTDRQALVREMMEDAYVLARMLFEDQPSLLKTDDYLGADHD